MERITHKGKIIEVFQTEVIQNGRTKTFEFARRSPGTRLIIIDGDKILLTKEFRHEVNGYDYRLPGGKVYDSLDEYNAALEGGVDINEAAKAAAIKEAREEVGIEPKDLTFFHKSVCGATVIWDLFYFVVKDFTKTGQNLENGEDITLELVSTDEAKAMCLDGRVSEERSALVLLRYLETLDK
ncbi:MAG TPA: NUDIX hydrolase [Candidatus Paceibacterota bacterium]|jgi:ADP-ribose pyrophosphatase|nr:NUDIX hydrolase [Candidatus Paceibacterota bacterium]